MERHSLNDGRIASRLENPNVFDDEYAVDDEGEEEEYGFGVADGFRPNQSTPGLSHQARDGPAPAQASSTTAACSIPETSSRQAASRNSTIKEHGVRSTSAVANQGGSAAMPGRTPSTYSQGSQMSALNRSISFSSSLTALDRSQSPFQDVAPSHPYGMYPQGTGVARSVSVTTSSTVQAPRRTSSAQQSPAHPYALYPQNVFADPEDGEDMQAQQPIPVGFPGIGHGYHRRIGPDGEEQDIIGPDGHTEQLPPYSRYPEEGVSKVLLVADTHDTHELLRPSAHNPVRLASIAPAADVGVAHGELASSGASEFSEKTWKEKSWEERRRTKFFGGKVPLWILLLVGALVIALVAGMGAGIGAVANHHKAVGEAQNSSTTVTVTASMFDASPIPTPTGLPPLPTGVWALPLGAPQEVQNSCLAEPDQLTAWSCDRYGPPLRLSIGGQPNNGSQKAFLSPMDQDLPLQYGTQPPEFGSHRMELVSDFDDAARGPAYHFSARYNKVVVVAEERFAAGQNLSKRSAPSGFSVPNQFRWDRKLVQAGSKPWFCTFYDTFIEGFIYINESVAASTSAAATSSAQTLALSSPTTLTSSQPQAAAQQTTALSAKPSAATTTAPAATVIPTVITLGNSLTITVAPPPSYTNPPADHPRYSYPPPASYARRAAAAAAAAASSSAASASAPASASAAAVPSNPPSGLMPFHALVKIEERRLPGARPAPQCQQMQVLYDGRWNPAVDANNNFILVQLDERDPGVREWEGRYPAASRAGGRKAKRTDPAGACHCQWFSCAE